MFGTLFKKKFAKNQDSAQPDAPSPGGVDRLLKGLEIKAQRLAQQRLLGRYRSRFKGRGLDFRDFREYLPGDDPRTIDWNVTARFGKPFVKNSEEERELAVVVILDLSPSQNFGSGRQTKSDLARELATLMALTAMASGDKVGLLVTDGESGRYIAPAKGRHQKQVVMQAIWQPLSEQSQTAPTTLFQSLDDLSRQLRKRGFLCIISDLLIPEMLEGKNDETSEKHLSTLRKLSFRHETIALRTLDKREREIPKAGTVTLRDQTDGRTVRVDTNHPDWREAFARKWEEWNSSVKDLMKRSRWDWQEFFTDADPLPPLASFLDSRGRR